MLNIPRKNHFDEMLRYLANKLSLLISKKFVNSTSKLITCPVEPLREENCYGNSRLTERQTSKLLYEPRLFIH